MKKWSKILAVVLALALLVCGVVIVATAEGSEPAGFSYEQVVEDENGNVTGYTPVSGDDDFGRAIKQAKPNTTVTMTGDMTWTFDTGYTESVNSSGITVKTGNPFQLRHDDPSQGKVTVDLGGHTLTIVQLYKEQIIKLSSQNLLTIKNGTIKVIWADESKVDDEKSFPLFEVGWGNSKITLEDVDTYSGSFFRAMYEKSTGGVPTITVKGGTHYVTKAVSDTFGGFIESRSNITFIAEDATFYLADNSYGLINSSHYRRGELTDKLSTFDFERCTVIGEKITTNIVRAANEYTFIKFLDCDIFGSFGERYYPTAGVEVVDIRVQLNDKVNGEYLGHILDGSIVIAAGSRIATYAMDGETKIPAYICDGTVYTEGEGETLKEFPTTSTVKFEDTELVRYEQGYGATKTLELPIDDVVVFDGEGNYTINYETGEATEFTYVMDAWMATPAFRVNDTVYIYGDITFPELIENAQSGDYITILYDCVVETFLEDSPFATLRCGITLDLGGKKLEIIQHKIKGASSTRGQSGIQIATEEEIVVKNGTLKAYHPGTNDNYPVFMVSSTSYKINFTVEDVESYIGTIIGIYNAEKGSVVNIVGGTHHAINGTSGYSSRGIVISLSPTTVNFKDTTVYTSGNGAVMGAARSSHNGNANFRGEQTWNFENCNLISGDGVNDPLIASANEYTRINFTNCNIYGSINPTQSTVYDGKSGGNDYTCAGPQPRTITFHEGNYFMSSATLTPDVVYPVSGDIVDASHEASFTYNENEGEGEYTTVTYILDKTVDTTYNYLVSSKDFTKSTYITGSFAKAVTQASTYGNGATIKVLGDVVWDGLHYTEDEKPVLSGNDIIHVASIIRGVTIDLDKRTFTIVQGNVTAKNGKNTGQETINIGTTQPVIVKNGTLAATKLNGVESYAMFISGTAGFDLRFENVKSYVGSLFYSYGANGKLTFTGGEHNAVIGAAGQWGGALVEVHNGGTITADGTKFIAKDSRYPFAFISNKNTMNFDISLSNCDVIVGTNGTGNVFKYANNLVNATFDNCRVYGSFTMDAHDYCKNNSKTAMLPGSIVMKNGTVFNGTYTEGLVVAPVGEIIETESSTVTLEYQDIVNTNFSALALSYVDKTVTYTFAYMIKEGTVIEYPIISGTAGGNSTSNIITIKPGELIPLPAIDTETVYTNGYYKLQYTGRWLDKDGNVVESLVAGQEDMILSPEANITPYLTAAKYNLKLMAHYVIHLMIPTNLPEGVNVTEVRNTSGSKLNKGVALYDGGVKVDSYTLAYVNATDIVNTTGASVTMTITLDGVNAGKTTTVVQTIKNLSVIKYINTVLSSKTGDEFTYSANERELVANLLKYSTLVCNYVGKAVPAAQQELYDSYSTVCTAIPEGWKNLLIQNADNTTANEALSGYVSSISFSIERDKPRIQLQIPYSAKATKVTLSVQEGWIVSNSYYEEGEGCNWTSTNLTPNANYDIYYWSTETDANGNNYMVWYNASQWKVVNIKGTWQKDNNGNYLTVDASTVEVDGKKYIAMIRPDNVPVYNVDKTVTISITSDNSAEPVVGTYSIGTYYRNMKNNYENGTLDEATFNKIEQFVLHVVAYSRSASGYRFGPAIDKDGNYVSFNREWGIPEAEPASDEE